MIRFIYEKELQELQEFQKLYDKNIRDECESFYEDMINCLNKKNEHFCEKKIYDFRKCTLIFDINFHQKYIKNKNIKTYF